MSEIASGSSRDYYARRAEQERLAAGRTTDPAARRVHLELTRYYETEIAMPAPRAQSANG